MTRVCLLVTIILLISIKTLGQCSDPPTVTLSSTSGSTCGKVPVTISNNTFGGSAKGVTITTDGTGTVNPGSTAKQKFDITYTPSDGDIGLKVLITVTTNNSKDPQCSAVTASYLLTVNANPRMPAVGTIEQPSCNSSVGSVGLSDLPSTGSWTLIRNPGAVTITGYGSTTTISDLSPGSYTFSVINISGCTSSASGAVVINPQPPIPTAPVIGTVTQPTCTVSKGSVVISGLPPSGTWVLIQNPGGSTLTGSGASMTISGLDAGTYNFTVTNSSGCSSASSGNAVINPQPPTPTAPVIGTITHPTCTVSTGSIGLSGLPSSGSWTITRNPGSVTTTGSGSSTIISGIASGTYTFTITNSAGCTSVSSGSAVINPQPTRPAAPLIGTITQPTCVVSTGSVMLSGLPSTGAWILVRSPGGATATGSGTGTTIQNLPSGTYTYTVTNLAGCVSTSSANIVITAQQGAPAIPVVGTITPPTCSLSTGSAVISGLPATGTWTLTRFPGSVTSTGTGTSIALTAIPAGIYNYTLTNSAGCVSELSANVVIPPQPPTPSAPIIGTITQPHAGVPTGTVVLNGLPGTGSWTLSLTPGNVATSGSGVTKTMAGLSSGTYSFTVTNSSGCISGSSANFTIGSNTGAPDVVITNPAPVCGPKTIDITAPGITAGSSPGLAYTYWVNAAATIQYNTPSIATSGTYYIKGTAADGFFLIKPVTVSIYQIPLANAGPNQVLANKYVSTMNAQLTHNYEYGIWSLISGSGQFFDATYTKSTISGLSAGKNSFLWTVSNGVCPSSSDTIMINVHDQIVPTLITPNMDGKNDYLVLKGTDLSGKREIVIFDRRGVEVYKNKNYDNSWNGIDFNGNPLPDDTYFYVLTEDDGNSLAGYILIRR